MDPVSLRVLAAILVIHCALISVAWPQDKRQVPIAKEGGVYRRPLANNPSTLDPALISDTFGFTVSQQIFDGLVQYDGSLTIVPAIAESWMASRDGLTWTFMLRKGVKFHHGREVVADDVVYSFTRILDPKTKSKAAEVFLKIRGAKEFQDGKAKAVSGLRTLDRYTIQIDLSEASAPFVASLAIGYAKIVPREIVEELGQDFGTQPVGTGPFKLVRWKKDELIVLEANKDYYARRPFLDRLEFRIFPGHQRDAMLASFEKGDLEDTDIPASEIDRLRADSRYIFVQRPILGVRFFAFNTQYGPLANRLVRQAFIKALDREEIARVIQRSRFRPGRGILPPGTYGYDPQFRPHRFDPQSARSLLAKAGYPEGKALPPLQVWSAARSGEIEREHEAIRKYMTEVGIRLEFHYNTNWPEFNSQAYEGKYPIFRYGWVADVPEPENFLYRLFHTQSRNNLARYRNERVDRLLDRARAEQVYLKRIELYREAERIIMEDAPIIPLNYYSYERLFQPYVQSIEVSALGDPYIPMRKIWLNK